MKKILKLVSMIGILAMSLINPSFAEDTNVHLDPKITNAVNPTDVLAWRQLTGAQNEYLYPSNAEVKVNSTQFDNFVRFSFYRKAMVTANEPWLFETFSKNQKIPYTFIWDDMDGINKRTPLYTVGEMSFLQDGDNYYCPGTVFFTASDTHKTTTLGGSKFYSITYDYMGTNYGSRIPQKMEKGKTIDAYCFRGTKPYLFTFTFSSPIDGYIHPMTATRVHEYDMAQPSEKNLEYVIMWSWNHVNGEYGEKAFFDNGRFNTPNVLGLRINNATTQLTTIAGTNSQPLTATASPFKETENSRDISVGGGYTNSQSTSQEYTSPSLTYTMSKAIAIAHASAVKTAYSGKAKVKIPLLGDVEHTVTIDYTGTDTKTDTVTETVAITLPSQKVKVEPGCTVRVAQMLHTNVEEGNLDIVSQYAGKVTSDAVVWQTNGTQTKASGSYNLYDLLKANNPNPSEKWIVLDDKNKSVVLHDMAVYTATKDNFVDTVIHMTCNGKQTSSIESTVQVDYDNPDNK